MKKFFIGMLGLAAVIALLLAITTPKPVAPTVFPTPNGYTNMLQAGLTLRGDPPEWRKAGIEELRAYVLTNTEALKLAHVGLGQTSRVTTAFTMAYLERHLAEIVGMKRLGMSMVAEGRLAELEKRTNDAVRLYLDGMHLAQETARGGLLIDKLVSVALEGTTLAPLEGLVNTLNASQCRDLIRGLEGVDATSEPIENIIERENYSCNHSGGWRGRIATFYMRSSLLQAQQSCSKKSRDRERQRRFLILNAAVRAYELEKGSQPSGLNGLVPAYLKAIPKDPATGAPMSFPMAEQTMPK